MAPGRYELLEHTADLWLRLRGPTPEDIFANAGWALFNLLTGRETTSGSVADVAEIEAADYDELLVHYLNELLYRFETRRTIFSEFRFEELTPQRLRVKLFGERIAPATFVGRFDIKSATYHELRFQRTADGYEASIILDI